MKQIVRYQQNHKRVSTRKVPTPIKKRSNNRTYSKRISTAQKVSLSKITLSVLVLSVLLVSVASYLVWHIVPGFLIRKGDVTYVIYSSSNETSPVTWWLIITRGLYRPTQVFQMTLQAGDTLQSGLVPDLTVEAILPLLASQEDNPEEVLLSQALGVLVDEAEQSQRLINSEEELIAFVYNQAWSAIKSSQWNSPWIQLALGLRNADSTRKTTIDTTIELVERVDLALMGDFSMCPVALLNTTDRNGLAGRYAALIEQSGGHVIRTDGSAAYDSVQSVTLGDADSSKQGTQLHVSKAAADDCSIASERLLEHFPNSELVVDELLPNRFRSKLVLVLGSDLLESGIFTASDQYLQ